MTYSSQISGYSDRFRNKVFPLGTISRQNYTNVLITGGSASNILVDESDITNSNLSLATINNSHLSLSSVTSTTVRFCSISDSVILGHASEDLKASNNLSDLTSTSTARTNLSLGSIATQNANAISITGGSITGITDLAIADGGTGASTAKAARDNLELTSERIDSEKSGFVSWSGSGNYYSITGDTFNLLRGGTGRIASEIVSWSAQDVSLPTISSLSIIYINSSGVLSIDNSSAGTSIFTDRILLFMVFRLTDGNRFVIKENHPYSFNSIVSAWAHMTAGTVLTNYGANIAIDATNTKIQLIGNGLLVDHGLTETISDSSGSGVTFYFIHGGTTAGTSYLYSTTDTFPMVYNNAGTVTDLGSNKYGLFRLYAIKGDLNTTGAKFIALLDKTQYNTQAAALNAITNGTVVNIPAAFSQIEIAQLGFVVVSKASNTIVTALIEKSVLNQAISGGTAAVGTMAYQDSSSVSITGGSISGITDLGVSDGGTGASTAAGARASLSVPQYVGTTTWTPANNNVSYSYAIGKYSRVGDVVTASFDLALPATSDANQCTITGLPYAANGSFGGYLTYSTFTTPVTLYIGNGATEIQILVWGGSAYSNVNLSGKALAGVVTYLTSAAF